MLDGRELWGLVAVPSLSRPYVQTDRPRFKTRSQFACAETGLGLL